MAAVRTRDGRQIHAGEDPNALTLCGELIMRVVMTDAMEPLPFVVAPATDRCPWCHFKLWRPRAGR